MRIAFVLYGEIDRISGGYLYDRKVVGALRDRGWHVETVGLKKIPYLLSPLQRLSPAIRTLFTPPGAKGTPAFDLVVIDELVHPSVCLALPRKRHARVVTLVHHLRCSERRPITDRVISGLLERALLNRSDLVVTTGRATASAVRPLIDDGVPIVTCVPGRDSFPRRSAPSGSAGTEPRGRSPGSVRILSVGILVPRKGYHLLIEALSSLAGLDWECTIAGDDSIDTSYAARLRRLADASGFGARLRIAGRVDDGELEALYRHADLFAFPSEFEGYGIVLAEAMGFALPYVATEGGALAELTGGREVFDGCGDGGVSRTPGGLVCADAASFAGALRMLVEDDILRSRLADEAARRFLSLPTWDDTGRCFAMALERAASSSGGLVP